MKTVVVGLGNPSFSDDGLGLLVARSIKNQNRDAHITVIESTAAGIDLLEVIADFDKAIIIDAIQTTWYQPGTIYRFNINQLSSASGESPHNMDFLAAVKLGQKLGLRLPGEIIVYGIEPQNVNGLCGHCTPQVKVAIPLCVEKIITEVG